MNASLQPSPPSVCREYPIAVVIPTYNRADALITCLEHLERQTATDFEVVVVDDGSSDGTPQRIQEYRKRTTLSMSFLQQQNGGPARARNVAISSVRSPLTLMIGDDIFATPELIETHLKLHQRRPESQVVGLGLTVWDAKMQELTVFMRLLDDLQFAYRQLLSGKAATWEHFYTSNLSVKTEVLRRNPFYEGFPNAAFEDIELGLRIARAEGLEIVFVPEALAHHFHPTTFVQACRRMRNVGWSAHLFHERWPETYCNPAGKTAVNRIVRRSLAPAPILSVATQFSSLLSRFGFPKGLFLAVLGTYHYLGYRDRKLQIRQSKVLSNRT